MKKLKIDEQLRDLLPPLTDDEFKQLEENILKEGCRDPIVTWKEYIVDGHNRYKICTKHNIEFKEIVLAYEDKDDIIQWMVDTQLGRRNLTPIQRIAIAEKYRPIFIKKAEENRGGFKGNQYTSGSLQKSATNQKIHTRNELSKIASVSHDTYSKGKKILDSDNEDIKQKVMNGELKINTAYNELFGNKRNQEVQEKSKLEKSNNKLFDEKKIQSQEINKSILKIKTKICSKCKIEKPLEDFYIGHDKCKECETKENEQTKEEGFLQKGQIFKDINGNPLPIKEEAKMDKSEFKEILQDLKTPKNYQDYINPDSELEWTKEICDDLIWQLDSKYFTLNKITDKLNKEHICLFINVLEEHINKINNIKNKLNERIGE